jgi:hypothetical protein
MIRITRPDGTIYEVETEREFAIIQKYLAPNGHAESLARPAAVAPTAPAMPVPSSKSASTGNSTLDEQQRQVLGILLGKARIDGDELRDQLNVETKELGNLLLRLSNRLKDTTGKSLDEYVRRTRTFKNGQRVKVYRRTKAGELLRREFQM